MSPPGRPKGESRSAQREGTPLSAPAHTHAGAKAAAEAGGGPAVEIYADGACRGNPGPGGWGVWLRSGAHEKELWGGAPQTTNNRMELTAVIEALASLKRRCAVTIHTDSEYVKNGITSWIHAWKRRGWRTADNKPVKNAELWERLDHLNGQHDVHWRWVKGHAGDPGNERADALANRGVDEMLGRRASG